MELDAPKLNNPAPGAGVVVPVAAGVVVVVLVLVVLGAPKANPLAAGVVAAGVVVLVAPKLNALVVDVAGAGAAAAGATPEAGWVPPKLNAPPVVPGCAGVPKENVLFVPPVPGCAPKENGFPAPPPLGALEGVVIFLSKGLFVLCCCFCVSKQKGKRKRTVRWKRKTVNHAKKQNPALVF